MGRWAALLAVVAVGCAPLETSAATTRTPSWGEPTTDSHDVMGDGYHPMGGVDGKNWGVWESAGAVKDVCEWSVRSIADGRGADILDEGSAGVGERVRVAVNPDGGVSVWTGEIEGHRIMFVSHGCATWYLS